MTLEQHCSVSQTSVTFFFCISVTFELRLFFCVLWCLWWSSCVPPPFAQGLHHQNHHGITRIVATLPESSLHHQNHYGITRNIVTLPESSKHHQNHHGITRIIVTPLESSWHHNNRCDTTRIVVTLSESLRHHQKHGDITRIIRILRTSLESSTLQATKEVQMYNIIT